MKTYDVYGSKSGLDRGLYSEGVTRHFGENRSVTTETEVFLASVQPLMCDPKETGLVKVGTLVS